MSTTSGGSLLHTILFLAALIWGPGLASTALQRIWRPGTAPHPSRVAYPWTVAGVVVAVVGMTAKNLLGDPLLANLFQHAVGGGVVSFCVSMSVIRQGRFQLTGWQSAVVLLGAVSVLGISNELAEYSLEMLTSGRLVFSPDTHDTWRDLAANTIGMFTAWGVWSLLARRRDPT
jgi:hypothetical protein